MDRNAAAATTARAVRALPVLVAVSGAAALVYESLWLRAFGLIFGNTTTAVAMVLAVFMSGLALGSAIAAHRRSADPLRTYARVELGVGVSALVTLPVLRATPWAYPTFAALSGVSGGLEVAGRMILSAVVLLPTTALLGATVPLALAFLARAGSDVRVGFGRLYLVNTLGGAAGVVTATFVLMQTLGLRGTLIAAASASLLVGGLVLRWAREIGPPGRLDDTPASAGPPAPQTTGDYLGPALAAVSGAATFGVEVLWTRSLALVVGSTVYAFNLMLLAVLLGLALGTALYPKVRPLVRRPAGAVGFLFVCAGFAVVNGQMLIGWLPAAWLALLGVLPVSFGAHQIAIFFLCLLALLPVTALFGLTFPLLLHLHETHAPRAQRDSGRIYAWNTAGAVAGALAVDLWLVPRLGLQPPYFAFALPLIAGGVFAFLASRGFRLRTQAALTLLVIVSLGVLTPHWKPWDPVVMTSGVHRYGLSWSDSGVSAWRLGSWLRERRSLVYYREGAEAVVAVVEPKGASDQRFLSVNGKTDAGGGALDLVTQRFIAHVPLLLHASPRQALVIGWGSGVTAATAARHPIESLECVEIEGAVFEAARFFPNLNGEVLRDPRLRLVRADGRNYLLRARTAYDVIVSEPSNPWISGVSNLFTREFYQAALASLAPGGVFGQWFHYYSLDPADVKVEAKTFLSVFPHASLWLVPPVGSGGLAADLLLVGSREPQVLDWARVERAFGDARIGADLRSTGVLGDPTALVATWTMGRREMEDWSEDRRLFPGGTPLNTDDYPYLELVAPRRGVMRAADTARLNMAQYQAMSRLGGDVRSFIRGQPAVVAGGPILAVFLDRLGEQYAQTSQGERAIAVFEAAAREDPRDAQAQARAGQLLFERGESARAEVHLQEAVRLDPTRARAWEALGAIANDRRDYPRAEEAHRALLRLEPANVPAWLHLGAALARQGQWVQAKDALDTARSIDPTTRIDSQLAAYLAERARASVRP